MADLDGLAHMIYHEKQQAGSMLCAQHALNSLLQGNYFTAPDLSDIARNLDALEESYDDDNAGNASTNMDDTGFFSIQVLENALKVWGLNLTRWRSEEMRPYHEHPHTQFAFILNLEQHWFTLRRFGNAASSGNADLGDGHWFNLNSSFPAPQWVGKLYLGMVIQQAEADGYSVFAITQTDPSAPLTLPYTEADMVASTLPEPRSTGSPEPQSFTPSYTTTQQPTSSAAQHGPVGIEDLEDEDYELQVALQASMMGRGSSDPYDAVPLPPRLVPATFPSTVFDPSLSSASTSGVHTPTNASAPPPSMPSHLPDNADLDPVSASLERNRVMLQRMREQQELAQRELWASTAGTADAAAQETRRDQRRKQQEEEEAQLQRAIEESEALARDAKSGESSREEDVSIDDGTAPPAGNGYPRIFASGDRVYDDDDAELQAALRASLEQVPHGWELPEPPALQTPVRISAPASAESDRRDDESILSDETNISENPTSDAGQPVAESVSVDELRKKRLAKFGG